MGLILESRGEDGDLPLPILRILGGECDNKSRDPHTSDEYGDVDAEHIQKTDDCNNPDHNGRYLSYYGDQNVVRLGIRLLRHHLQVYHNDLLEYLDGDVGHNDNGEGDVYAREGVEDAIGELKHRQGYEQSVEKQKNEERGPDYVDEFPQMEGNEAYEEMEAEDSGDDNTKKSHDDNEDSEDTPGWSYDDEE